VSVYEVMKEEVKYVCYDRGKLKEVISVYKGNKLAVIYVTYLELKRFLTNCFLLLMVAEERAAHLMVRSIRRP
jgi:hypothetical protein